MDDENPRRVPDHSSNYSPVHWGDLLPASSSIPAIAEVLAALANGQGGTLLLDLSGLDAATVIDRVREAALCVEPALMLSQPVTLDNTTLAVTVPRGLPHAFAVEGRYPVRDGLEIRALKTGELRRLLLQRGELSFEETLCLDASLDDLDWTAVEAYTARFGSGAQAQALLEQRGCIARRDKLVNGYGADRIPTYAGILLFGKDPQRFVRNAFITAARFAGPDMSDTFTRQEMVGSLIAQIAQAETFLLDNLRRSVQLGGNMERTEALEYPMEAARELVINAIAHRDYSIQGDGIRLFLFANRFEVTSPGGLPGPVTVDNIVDERYSRNSIIVQVLADLGYIERLGYGVDRVIALMRDRGLPAPHFEETAGGFRVRLFNTGYDQQSTELQAAFLNPRQESALYYLQEGGYRRITNKDIQELFPDIHPETIRRDLADLVNKGILVKLGQKRGSYYILKAANAGRTNRS